MDLSAVRAVRAARAGRLRPAARGSAPRIPVRPEVAAQSQSGTLFGGFFGGVLVSRRGFVPWGARVFAEKRFYRRETAAGRPAGWRWRPTRSGPAARSNLFGPGVAWRGPAWPGLSAG